VSTTVDVVVPTWNGFELTDSCLRQLAAQTVSHSVIVADDGSTDGTPARVRARHRARVVELGENRGFAAACNAGVAASEGEVIVLLNNDVDARPDFLERLLAPLAEAPRAGSVAATMVMPGERMIDSVGLSADRTLAGFARLHGRPLSEAASPTPLLAGPSGGAGAYRRCAWVEAGGLDEAIFAYHEDLDLALRLRTAGWDALAAPDAVAVHVGGATIGRRSAAQRERAGFARGYLLRRYGVLRGPAAPRALVTEALVGVADALSARDAAALRGRLAGWRAAAGLPRERAPVEAIDRSIDLRESMRLRRVALR